MVVGNAGAEGAVKLLAGCVGSGGHAAVVAVVERVSGGRAVFVGTGEFVGAKSAETILAVDARGADGTAGIVSAEVVDAEGVVADGLGGRRVRK